MLLPLEIICHDFYFMFQHFKNKNKINSVCIVTSGIFHFMRVLVQIPVPNILRVFGFQNQFCLARVPALYTY